MRTILAKKYNYGFSLLEVLVAFSIAAVTLAILFQIYAKGTRTAILGEEYAHAIIIAESRLATLSALENLNKTEDSGRENDKYDWKVTTEDYIVNTVSDTTPALLLKHVKVIVTWNSTGKTRSVNLNSLKPVPAT